MRLLAALVASTALAAPAVRVAASIPTPPQPIGVAFGAFMTDVDAFLLGRRTYVTHADAFEPMPAGDPFGDLMNTPAKYVVSKAMLSTPG